MGVPAPGVGPREQALAATTSWEDLKGNPSAQSCSHCPWGAHGPGSQGRTVAATQRCPQSRGPEEGWSRLPSRVPLPRDLQSPHLPAAWLRTAERESP